MAFVTNVERFLAARQALLDVRLREFDASAAADRLPEVTITNSVLKAAPLGKGDVTGGRDP